MNTPVTSSLEISFNDMRSYRRVHVQSEELEEIPVVRAPRIPAPPVSRFKLFLIASLIVVFVTTIVVSMVLFQHTHNKSIPSSTIKVTTASTIFPSTTSFSTFNQSIISITSTPTSTIDSKISSTDATALPSVATINVTDNITSIGSTTEITTTTTTTMIPPNLVLNPGAEAQFDEWMQTGASPVIIDLNGNFNRGYLPHSGTFCFAGGYAKSGPESKLVQRIRLLNGVQGFTEDQLDSGKLNVYLSFYYQTWKTGRPKSDLVKVDVAFRTDVAGELGGMHTGELVCKTSNPQWCQYTSSTPLVPGTRVIYYTMIFYKHDPLDSDTDSYIDDNSLIIM